MSHVLFSSHGLQPTGLSFFCSKPKSPVVSHPGGAKCNSSSKWCAVHQRGYLWASGWRFWGTGVPVPPGHSARADTKLHIHLVSSKLLLLTSVHIDGANLNKSSSEQIDSSSSRSQEGEAAAVSSCFLLSRMAMCQGMVQPASRHHRTAAAANTRTCKKMKASKYWLTSLWWSLQLSSHSKLSMPSTQSHATDEFVLLGLSVLIGSDR